jgi:hypothetical protein
MQKGELIVARDITEVQFLTNFWSRLRATEARYVPDFDDVLHWLTQVRRFIVLVEMRGSEPICVACFVEETALRHLTVGERSLGTVKVGQLALVGEVVLGDLRPGTWLRFLRKLDDFSPYDFIYLGEVPLNSDLWKATAALPMRYRISRPSRKEQLRWLIKLPEKFDDYLASLGTQTRQVAKRKIRKFEGGDGCTFEVFSDERKIDEFLSIAEKISRRTYQWSLDQKLQNDTATRKEYARLARAGKLRGYVLRIQGEPCAFIHGTLAGGVYAYRTPGFLSEYAKWSPGTVLLILVIKDLIESAKCNVFDFGTGGDQVGYKAKFGNVSIPSQTLLISRRLALRPALISLAQEALRGTKNIAARVLGTGELRRRIRRAMRGQ